MSRKKGEVEMRMLRWSNGNTLRGRITIEDTMRENQLRCFEQNEMF